MIVVMKLTRRRNKSRMSSNWCVKWDAKKRLRRNERTVVAVIGR